MPMPAVISPCLSTSVRMDCAIGAERLADAELATALRHAEREHAVDPDGRQDECD